MKSQKNRRGSQRDTEGMYVIIVRARTITKKNGMIPFDTSSKESFDMPQATNKFTPNGGVIKPIERLTTITIPKWTGSIPTDVAIGNNIGANIIIAAVVSIKVPTISKSIFINNKIIAGLDVRDCIKLAIVRGTCSIVRILPKEVAVPTMISTVAVVKAEFFKISGTSLSFNSLYTNLPIMYPYITATAPASVGVKTPPYIPPNIISGIIKDHLASLTADNKFLIEKLEEVVDLYPCFLQ